MEESKMKRTILIMLLSTLLLSCNNSEKEPTRAIEAKGNMDNNEMTDMLDKEDYSPQESSCEIVFLRSVYLWKAVNGFCNK